MMSQKLPGELARKWRIFVLFHADKRLLLMENFFLLSDLNNGMVKLMMIILLAEHFLFYHYPWIIINTIGKNTWLCVFQWSTFSLLLFRFLPIFSINFHFCHCCYFISRITQKSKQQQKQKNNFSVFKTKPYPHFTIKLTKNFLHLKHRIQQNPPEATITQCICKNTKPNNWKKNNF